MMLHLDLNQLDSLRPRCFHCSQLTGGSSTSLGLAARCAKAGGGWKDVGPGRWVDTGKSGEWSSASKRCRRKLSKQRLSWIDLHWVECVWKSEFLAWELTIMDLLIANSTRFIQLSLALCFCISNSLVFIFCGCDTGKALQVKRGKPLAFKRKLCWDYSHALEALVKQSLISKLHHEVPGLRYLNFQTAQAVGRMKLNFGIVCWPIHQNKPKAWCMTHSAACRAIPPRGGCSLPRAVLDSSVICQVRNP